MQQRAPFLRQASGPALVSALVLALVMGLAALDAPRGWILACGALGLLAVLLTSLAGPKPSGRSEGPGPAAEPAPAAPERHPRGVAETVPALIWIMNADGRTVFQNRRVVDYAGQPLDDLTERTSLIHPDDRADFLARREAGRRGREEFHLQVRLRRHDGTYRWHQVTGTPFDIDGDHGMAVPEGAGDGLWLASAIDIEPLKQAGDLQGRLNAVLETRIAETTQQLSAETAVRRKAERQLRHSQKMEAISRLTGGIAHDLNNKLMVISANIDAVVKHIKEQPLLRRKLLAALVASDQAAGLMSKLLAFARQRDLHPQYIDVAEHLESISDLLDRSFLSDSVEVRLTVPEDLWSVEVDPHQLETAIVNLALNARDAMPEGGTIAIEARNARIDETQAPEPGLFGEFVRITVLDTGRGIPPEHLDQVFEPFFTTKEASRASGLGLSQVHGFAQQLGGTVEISSTVGQGTAVSLYLPRAELPARVGTPAVFDDLMDDEDVATPSAEILLVDDEVEVALALQGMLDELGYATRIAIGAEEAMEALRARRPHLVLTDVTMPGTMDGVKLGQEIRKRHPDLPVVLITGNPMVAGVDEFPLIQKPIASRALHTALQRHLAPPSGDDNVVPLFSDKRRTST